MDVKKPPRHVRRHTTGLIVFTDDADFGRVEDTRALPCGIHLLNAHTPVVPAINVADTDDCPRSEERDGHQRGHVRNQNAGTNPTRSRGYAEVAIVERK